MRLALCDRAARKKLTQSATALTCPVYRESGRSAAVLRTRCRTSSEIKPKIYSRQLHHLEILETRLRDYQICAKDAPPKIQLACRIGSRSEYKEQKRPRHWKLYRAARSGMSPQTIPCFFGKNRALAHGQYSRPIKDFDQARAIGFPDPRSQAQLEYPPVQKAS